MYPTKAKTVHSRGLLAAWISASAAILVGCATTGPEPTVALKAAEQAIAVADAARPAGTPSAELSESRDKLAAAQLQVRENHMLQAERLATEARAGAELAFAKNELVKAVAVNDEMKRSTEVLGQEMQRNAGVTK
jgi:hypothetical protein